MGMGLHWGRDLIPLGDAIPFGKELSEQYLVFQMGYITFQKNKSFIVLRYGVENNYRHKKSTQKIKGGTRRKRKKNFFVSFIWSTPMA